jgi:hypothetical protein
MKQKEGDLYEEERKRLRSPQKKKDDGSED